MSDLIKYNKFKRYYLIKILKNIWSKNIFKSNFLILEVDLYSNKKIIKDSIEFIFNIKILKINTLIKKYFIYKNKKIFKVIKKKKAFVKF